jgi:hypothetical protein
LWIASERKARKYSSISYGNQSNRTDLANVRFEAGIPDAWTTGVARLLTDYHPQAAELASRALHDPQDQPFLLVVMQI